MSLFPFLLKTLLIEKLRSIENHVGATTWKLKISSNQCLDWNWKFSQLFYRSLLLIWLAKIHIDPIFEHSIILLGCFFFAIEWALRLEVIIWFYFQTCLHLSVLLRRPYITRKLLLAGAKTGCEDKNGNTALHLACKMNNLACVEALLNKTLIYRDMVNTVFMYKPKIDLPHMYINEWNYDGEF